MKSYCFESRASRRRNCLTETTRTRWRRAIRIRSRSRLRSSSRVTRYVAFPIIAASKISSSSGSRQTFSSPEVSTNVVRAAISLTNLSACRCGYLNLRKSRGRLRTSASSVSWKSDVTALNWPWLHAVTIFPEDRTVLENPRPRHWYQAERRAARRAAFTSALALLISASISF